MRSDFARGACKQEEKDADAACHSGRAPFVRGPAGFGMSLVWPPVARRDRCVSQQASLPSFLQIFNAAFDICISKITLVNVLHKMKRLFMWKQAPLFNLCPKKRTLLKSHFKMSLH